jgi:hypothetical protein
MNTDVRKFSAEIIEEHNEGALYLVSEIDPVIARLTASNQKARELLERCNRTLLRYEEMNLAADVTAYLEAQP